MSTWTKNLIRSMLSEPTARLILTAPGNIVVQQKIGKNTHYTWVTTSNDSFDDHFFVTPQPTTTPISVAYAALTSKKSTTDIVQTHATTRHPAHEAFTATTTHLVATSTTDTPAIQKIIAETNHETLLVASTGTHGETHITAKKDGNIITANTGKHSETTPKIITAPINRSALNIAQSSKKWSLHIAPQHSTIIFTDHKVTVHCATTEPTPDLLAPLREALNTPPVASTQFTATKLFKAIHETPSVIAVDACALRSDGGVYAPRTGVAFFANNTCDGAALQVAGYSKEKLEKLWKNRTGVWTLCFTGLGTVPAFFVSGPLRIAMPKTRHVIEPMRTLAAVTPPRKPWQQPFMKIVKAAMKNSSHIAYSSGGNMADAKGSHTFNARHNVATRKKCAWFTPKNTDTFAVNDLRGEPLAWATTDGVFFQKNGITAHAPSVPLRETHWGAVILHSVNDVRSNSTTLGKFTVTQEIREFFVAAHHAQLHLDTFPATGKITVTSTGKTLIFNATFHHGTAYLETITAGGLFECDLTKTAHVLRHAPLGATIACTHISATKTQLGLSSTWVQVSVGENVLVLPAARETI